MNRRAKRPDYSKGVVDTQKRDKYDAGIQVGTITILRRYYYYFTMKCSIQMLSVSLYY